MTERRRILTGDIPDCADVATRSIATLMVLSILLVLASCSATKPTDNAPALPASFGDTDTDKVKHAVADPEVAAIWMNAEIARSRKQYAEASEHVENALRIVPDDPIMWSRLAELRLQLGEFVLAENYAAKSNALASENRVLVRRNWLIIQHARDKRGDVLGAREAQIEVRNYSAQ